MSRTNDEDANKLAPKALDDITVDQLMAHYERAGSGLTDLQLSHQTRVALRHLYTTPHIFQPRKDEGAYREILKDHIKGLSRVAEAKDIEPITLLPVDGLRIVIDGHSTLTAYHKAGRKPSDRVPIRYFKPKKGRTTRREIFADAYMHSIGANSKDKLPLWTQHKSEAAWERTRFNERHKLYSLRQIAEKTGVSLGTAQKMAAKLKADPSPELRTKKWWQVLNADWTPNDDGEDRNEAQVLAFLRKFKTFGKSIGKQTASYKKAMKRHVGPTTWASFCAEVADDEVFQEKVLELVEELFEERMAEMKPHEPGCDF